MSDADLAGIPLIPSQKLSYQQGMKYRVTDDHGPIVHRLRYDYGLQESWVHPEGYYGVVEDDTGQWFLVFFPGCCWNGATLYFDWRFMQYPSLVHDGLHWLIARGIIDEKYNDIIDMELGYLVRISNQKIKWWQGGELTRVIRAKMVEHATHLVNEKRQADYSEFPTVTLEI